MIPFVPTISHMIRRKASKLGINTVFKRSNTLRDLLTKVKPSSEPLEKKGVIYQQSCGECQLKYIGETGRRAVVRKKEHLTSFKKADTKICHIRTRLGDWPHSES